MARGRGQRRPVDWVTRAADDAVRHAGEGDLVDRRVRRLARRARSTWATCASSSPSHFVAEELRRRGVPVRHLHSWDDYDRFRKVPAGVDPSWAEHIGRPLTAVPDPWECHASWAEHFKAAAARGARRAGRGDGGDLPDRAVHLRASTASRSCTAVARRDEIEAVLAQHRTKKRRQDASEQEAPTLAERSPTRTRPERPPTRFPFKPYCRQCGRDTDHHHGVRRRPPPT